MTTTSKKAATEINAQIALAKAIVLRDSTPSGSFKIWMERAKAVNDARFAVRVAKAIKV